ncbi:MAG: heparinase II/III family protein [Gemmatimonadaceae bacterium]|nr:heparinase II/III family protein [Gemmatimonadaceae bacterium]
MNGKISPFLVARTEARRALVNPGEPFAALADGLSGELEMLIDAPLPIPAQKARLTRIGGRCPEHGVLLDFDPLQPHEHRCARCETIYRGVEHDQWWAMGAQLFTAERAVHAATLFALRGDLRHAHLSARILREYTERYETWPNRDNVLGPSRPFFSTYLESIWLLNLCHAAGLLETHASVWTSQDAQRLRDRVLGPSARLVEGYHEGRSNRQVWNEVAICSAWTLLGRDDDARARLASSTGLRGLIEDGLDADGFWYEGENYHMFAHRGMWYGVALTHALGMSLPTACERRYRAGFVAPFLGVLPDDTFPSRRDSQYASSVRQWRTAEWCELGWAETHDVSLAAVLASMYRPEGARRETGRRTSTADAERNWPSARLTRADLSWRALWMAEGVLPDDIMSSPGDVDDAPREQHNRARPLRVARSVAVPAHGLAIIRRDEGELYLALDGGRSGGGHGHPDQLALTVQRGQSRWLDDPGTGSYVEAKLAWYRSTLAHHAPFLDGQSQRPARADLLAFHDEQNAADAGSSARSADNADGGYAWMVKSVEDLLPGTRVQRTIVVGPGYLVDSVEWQGNETRTLTLPLIGAAYIQAPELAWQPNTSIAALGDDPAWTFVRELSRAASAAPLEFVAPAFAAHVPSETCVVEDALRGWYTATSATEYWRGIVPAAPGLGETTRLWLTSRAASGRVVGVLSWGCAAGEPSSVRAVDISRCSAAAVDVDVTDEFGGVHRHTYADGVWRVASPTRETRQLFVISTEITRSDDFVSSADENVIEGSSYKSEIITLALNADNDIEWPRELAAQPAITRPLRSGLCTLGATHYVPTEDGWQDAGAPTARLGFGATPTHLVVDIQVHTGHQFMTTDERENPLDNEPHATNADGVQWYIASPTTHVTRPEERWEIAGLVAGRADGPPIQRSLGVRELLPEVAIHGRADGWSIRLAWPLSALPVGEQGTLDVEVVINERPPGRERRRGQLVLSGGGGFGYLAGARRRRDRYVRLQGVPRPSATSSP